MLPTDGEISVVLHVMSSMIEYLLILNSKVETDIHNSFI